ncbi:hypothetical protein [Cereibacter azotoformans]|uniref:hypothetical protein n=1 Tax=Cereibacter azotoformans TaxID=43057 RepID=UPI00117B0C9A|nr:hypothetical protein [Cereibacter azotoformans]
MKITTPPYRQGDLDCLCSMYAAINLLQLRGHIRSIEEAGSAMRTLVAHIVREGNLELVLTKGVYRSDLNAFFSELKHNSKKVNRPSTRQIEHHAKDGAVIFFESEDRTFDHYTVIRIKEGTERVELFDSYGFREIHLSDGRWFVDNQPISILNLYYLEC